jgi:hypothetical protein
MRRCLPLPHYVPHGYGSSRLGLWRNRRWDSPAKIRSAPDSALEEDGFELPVPPYQLQRFRDYHVRALHHLFCAVVKRSEIRTANSVRASLLKTCRPDRRVARPPATSSCGQGSPAPANVPRPGSSISSPRPIRNKKTRAWLTTAPRVASVREYVAHHPDPGRCGRKRG